MNTNQIVNKALRVIEDDQLEPSAIEAAAEALDRIAKERLWPTVELAYAIVARWHWDSYSQHGQGD